MVPGAVMLTLGGAVGMGVGQVFQRHMLRKDRRLFTEPEVALAKYVLDFAGYLLIVAPLWSFLAKDAPTPNRLAFWWAVAGWSVANIGVTVASLYAARFAEVSLTLPYQAMTPGILTLAVFLIGERPSAWGYVGIATIAVGTYIHGRLGAGNVWAYLTPLWRLFFLPANYRALDAKTQEKARHEQLGVRFAFVSAFCGTFGLLGEGLMARHGNPAVGGLAGYAFLAVFSITWNRMIGKNRRASSLPPFHERLRSHGKLLGARGIASLAASFLPMIANRLAPIVYVGTFKRLSIPIGVFVAARWFREKVPAGRWATIVMVTIGAVILALDDTPAKIVGFIDRFLAP